MQVFEGIKATLENLFGIKGNGWVKRKSLSPNTIESCNGEAKKDETTKTCALCVALNETIFKNDNKPSYYHLYCKCNNEKTTLPQVSLNFPMAKITKYLFYNKDKKAMMRTMGYTEKEADNLYLFLYQTVEKEFLAGRYLLKNLDIHGQHFSIKVKLKGVNDHTGETFNCHVGCVAWPNGKIKIATPIIKD